VNSAADNIFRLNTKNPDAVISLIDESLEMNNHLTCDLFASVSSSEVSLALLDKKKNKFLALEVFQNASTGISEEKWLNDIPGKSIILKNLKYKSAAIAVANEFTTLVPSALFREEDVAKYFQYNFNRSDLHVHAEKISSFEAVNVFALPHSFEDSLNKFAERPVIFHQATALLSGVNLLFRKIHEKILVLNVGKSTVEIVVTGGRRLIFSNAFSYQSMEDLAYYVMFTCDRLQLNPETISTYVFGSVEKDSAVYRLLAKYIANIRFGARLNSYEFSYVFKDIPDHFYFHLFSLALCES
jgi:hypothetical protein